MCRIDRKRRHTSPKSAPNELSDLAAGAQSLLVRLLPHGVDAALDQIRQIQSSLHELPDELEYLRSEPRLVAHVILLVAERALVGHIEKEKKRNSSPMEPMSGIQ
jgi:hypothetical protein